MKLLKKLHKLGIEDWIWIIGTMLLVLCLVALATSPSDEGILESIAREFGELVGEVVNGFEKARGK